MCNFIFREAGGSCNIFHYWIFLVSKDDLINPQTDESQRLYPVVDCDEDDAVLHPPPGAGLLAAVQPVKKDHHL